MCIHKVIPKCQSSRFHTAKFIVMLIAIIIIMVIVIIPSWLWNVPPLAEVVENGTYSDDDCDCPLWGEAYFAVEDMKPTFHLPNSSLHNISCMFVCSKENS